MWRTNIKTCLVMTVILLGLWPDDANGLALWQFEEGGGTIAYDSFGNNNGTIYGANWTTGMIGGALDFDGVDDYVDVGNDSSLKPPLPVTLCAWMNLSSLGSPQCIMVLDAQTSGYYGIWWYVGAAGDLEISYGDGGGGGSGHRRSKVGTTQLGADTWYHVAAVIRGQTDMSLYINGIDDGGTYSGSGGSLHYSSATSLIGMKHDSQYALGGKIDDVRVYERSLFGGEIWEVYQQGLGAQEYPFMYVRPKTLEFLADEGGSNPASRTISIRNIGVGVLNYCVTESCPWLEVEPNAGSSTGETDEVTLSVEISGLTKGWYDCTLGVSDPCAFNDPQLVTVTLGVGVGGPIYVPSECPTIQAAIDLVVDGATVIVEPGVYSGVGNRDLDFGGKAITVRSIDPGDPCVVAATVIDCNGTESEPHRGFYFSNGEGPSSIISGLTIKNGLSKYGGGIYCNNSSPMIKNCVIAENVAEGRLLARGGGIYCSSGEPRIINCTITQNSISAQNWPQGSAIWCEESKPLIKGCLVSNNFGSYGSIVAGYDSELTIIGCIINGNSGYIQAHMRSHAKIDNSVISGNYGGAYIHSFSSLDIRNCLVAGNSSVSNSGPGLSFGWESSFAITNCTIVDNVSLSGEARAGGIMYNSLSSSGNVTNSIIWGNSGQQIGSSPTPGDIAVTYCDVEGGYPGIGNSAANPCFVNADSNDFHLWPDSPCIDAGDNNSVPPDSNDLDGNPRIVDGDNDGNAVVDMGAFEYFVAPIEVGMKFTPQALNPGSKGKWVKAHFVLPEEYAVEDVDVNTPAVVQPGGIEADYMNVFVNEANLVEIEAAFDRGEFCGIVTGGQPIEVSVTGSFISGQQFCGTDTIKITTNIFEYLAVLASRWLEEDCGKPDWCEGADLDQDSMVNFRDFVLFDGCCIQIIAE